MHLTMHLDRAGCAEPRFRWVSSIGEALTALREQSFDCIVICDVDSQDENGTSPELLSFVRGARSGGHTEPILLVVPAIHDRELSECCATDCDVLVTLAGWSSSALVPMIGRLVQRMVLYQENRRLNLAENRRQVRERDEAAQILSQQRQLLSEIEGLTGSSVVRENSSEGRRGTLPAYSEASPSIGRASILSGVLREVGDQYQELLRGYVMMGSRNLGAEIARMAKQIIESGLSPRQVLQLHLERVESLLDGLGKRSARHVLARADLLALELLVQISEQNPTPRALPQTRLRRVSSDGGIDLSAMPTE